MTMPRQATNLAALLGTLQELKRVKRTGWIDRGVPLADVESVADHTYLTALIAWFVALDEPGLDADKVLKLAVIHDIAESIYGDEPPYSVHEVPDRSDADAHQAFFSVNHVRSPEDKARKRSAEQAAFEQLTEMMSPAARDTLVPLWDEYEAQTSPEARFVKEVDTLEAYLQARHYAAGDPALPLNGFFDMAAGELRIPSLTAVRDATTPEET